MTPRVVIIGAGFGGLYAARALSKAPVEVTLIDRRNHHVFQPLLYQVATAGLNPSDIAAPIRKILRRQTNLRVLLAEATSIDPDSHRVTLDGDSLHYDYLIVATGATPSYFGHDEWAGFAPGLKSIEDALDIRRRLLLCFEAAEKEADDARRSALLTLVIVGGGPTGVELAGSIAEMARNTLKDDFRSIDTSQTRVILLEAADRILPTFTAKLSQKATAELRKLGVEVATDEAVNDIDSGGVTTGSRRLDSGLVMWAAGVRASPLGRFLPGDKDRSGRILVGRDLTLEDHDDVFVIGDLARVEDEDGVVPGVAQAAMQMADCAARSIVSRTKGGTNLPFKYLDKGMLAIIGRSFAVADLRRRTMWGFPAVLVWLFVHIWFLIGFRNRVLVIFQWLWAYLTWERGARLITEPHTRNDRGVRGE